MQNTTDNKNSGSKDHSSHNKDDKKVQEQKVDQPEDSKKENLAVVGSDKDSDKSKPKE